MDLLTRPKKSPNKIISNFCLKYLFNSAKGTGDHEPLKNIIENFSNFSTLSGFHCATKRLLNTYNSDVVGYILFCKKLELCQFRQNYEKICLVGFALQNSPKRF